MKYHKIYTITAVFFLVVFSGFLCKVCFWPETQVADAMQVKGSMPRQADAKPTSNNDNGLAAVNYSGIESISDEIYIDYEQDSLLTQNSLSGNSVIEISPDDSQSEYHFASLGDSSAANQSDSSFVSSASSSSSSQSSTSSSSDTSSSGSSGSSGGGGSTADTTPPSSGSSAAGGQSAGGGGGSTNNTYVPQIQILEDSRRGQAFQSKVDKNFSVGDRLLMPLGMYSVTNYFRNTEELRTLTQNGILFVHRYINELSIKEAQDDIQNIKKAGTTLAFCLPESYYSEGVLWWKDFFDQRSLFSSNSIVFWYLHGEPERSEVVSLDKLTQFLHQNDVIGRPIISYHNDTDATAIQMAGFLDGILFGAYPGTSKLLGYPRVRIAYNMHYVQRYGGVIIAPLEAYETKSGFPSAYEMKFDAYLALINGARGLMWYNYTQVKDKPLLLNAIFEISRLLNGNEFLGEVFIRGQQDLSIKANIIKGPSRFNDGFHAGMMRDMPNNPSIHWRCLKYFGNQYLIAVNTCEVVNIPHHGINANEENLTVEVEFEGFAINSQVIALDASSSPSFDEGILYVKLRPLETVVFKITTTSQGQDE
jgi:hypothetical protein